METSNEKLAMKIYEAFMNAKKDTVYFHCRRQARSTRRRTVQYLRTLFLIANEDVSILMEKRGIAITRNTVISWP